MDMQAIGYVIVTDKTYFVERQGGATCTASKFIFPLMANYRLLKLIGCPVKRRNNGFFGRTTKVPSEKL